MPPGSKSSALVAGPASPLKPYVPLPATVVIVGASVTFCAWSRPGARLPTRQAITRILTPAPERKGRTRAGDAVNKVRLAMRTGAPSRERRLTEDLPNAAEDPGESRCELSSALQE